MIFFYTIKEALEWFTKESLMIFSTETVYGLGAKADDTINIKKIYQIKNRPLQNPLIIHFHNLKEISKYCKLNEIEYKLIQYFSPGPLTLLLNKKDKDIFKQATCGSSKICCRIPANEFALELIKHFGPIAAPSCNLSGKLTITTAHMIEHEYKNINIGAYVNDASIKGIESTIIEVNNNDIIILREGLITYQDLQNFLHKNNLKYKILKKKQSEEFVTPGSYFAHYQIKKPLYIQTTKDINSFHIGLGEEICDFNLSPTKNREEIIKNYFYSLFLGDISILPIVTMTPFSEDLKLDELKDRLNKTLNMI